MTLLEIVVAVAIAVGLAGVVLPFLPGTLLVAAAISVWTFDTGGRAAWVVLGVALALLALGTLLKYAVPGRRLKASGVPNRTLWSGAGLAVVGFFVVPVIGLPLGFVLGVYLAERSRVGGAAWPATRATLGAVGLGILIELTAGLLAALTWVGGVVAT